MKQILRQILLSLALLILCAAVAGIPAAGAASGDEKGCDGNCNGQCQKKEMGKKMKQFQKDLGLTDSQVQQLKSLKERHKGERKAHFEAVQEKIKAVLTPDQMALWEKNKAGMHPQQGVKPDMEAIKNKRKAMMMELALTDTQKNQIKTIMKEERDKQKAIMQSELKSILTAEQYRKFEEKMKCHKDGKGFKNREGHKPNKADGTKTTDKSKKNPLEFEYK
jgi:Spy/CpxP family protein refolding chaperone